MCFTFGHHQFRQAIQCEGCSTFLFPPNTAPHLTGLFFMRARSRGGGKGGGGQGGEH